MDLEYATSDYLNHYRDFISVFRDQFGEPLLNPFVTHPHMKNFYLVQDIDLRIQVDHVNHRKNHFVKKTEVILSTLMLKLHCLLQYSIVQTKVLSDGNKITQVKVILKDA